MTAKYNPFQLLGPTHTSFGFLHIPQPDGLKVLTFVGDFHTSGWGKRRKRGGGGVHQYNFFLGPGVRVYPRA